MSDSDDDFNNSFTTSSVLFVGTISPSSKSTSSSTCSEPKISGRYKPSFGIRNSKLQQNRHPSPKEYQIERSLRQDYRAMLYDAMKGKEADKPFSSFEFKFSELVSKALELGQFRGKSIGLILNHPSQYCPEEDGVLMKPAMLRGVDGQIYHALTTSASCRDVEIVAVTCTIQVDDGEFREVSKAEKELLGLLGTRMDAMRRYQIYVYRYEDGSQFANSPKRELASWRSYRNDWEDDMPVRFLNEATDCYASAIESGQYQEIGKSGGDCGSLFEIHYDTYAILAKK